MDRIDPKVDEYYSFYAWFLLGLGIVFQLPVVIFVMARITGWTAHIMEQLSANRLIRPLSQYTGPAQRRVPPPGNR